jgi:MFS family permease
MIRMHMSTRLRRSLYALLALSWVSGVVYFVLSRWMQVDGEFGLQKNPWQFPLLKVHGAAAFLMLMAIGAMLVNHVPASWRTHRSRGFGLTLVVGVSLMVISAWCLYYAADEYWRPILGNIHAAIGFALPLILAIHIWRGRRAALAKRTPRLPEPSREPTRNRRTGARRGR